MAKKLVIVESPAKAKTIQKYLGKGFVVKSSYGHVRDLPKSKIGVDVENDFEPTYTIPARAKPKIKILQDTAKKVDEIYFATDEDREGEAIAWHLAHILNIDPKKAKRITFTEITKSAITKAIENPRALNIELVNAQQSRRILDRLVGYELSPLLWNKVRRGLSAGRVQSVAVRLIVEREDEIKAFKADEYWSINAILNKDNTSFEARLAAKGGKTYKKLDITTKKETEKILKDLDGATYIVSNVEKKERKRTPPAPFTTSSLQQASFNQLGYSSKKTMVLAQQLYENGFITYMRTDSVNLATEATAKAREAITTTYGKEYALEKPRVFSKKSKGAQEAHEAIRPTEPTLIAENLPAEVDAGARKLYQLIWRRMVASQMTDARLEQTSIDIAAADYTFRASGMTVLFDGFVRALGEKAALKETVLPAIAEKDELGFEKLEHEQHFTQPPARYSEATLVKALEEIGVGRPSTYAPTIDTVQRREYVQKNDDRRLEPTEVGTLVNSVLVEHFPDIVDYEFTAGMEDDLDNIAEGKQEWQPFMKKFYKPFHKQIKLKDKELKKEDLTQEETGEVCPKDGGKIVIKLGRFGKFKACTNYPECKHTEPIGEEKDLQAEYTGKKCPDCGKDLVVKRGRFGPFLGCSGYPDCKHIDKIEKETGATCPKCNKGKIVEKKSRKGRTFFACNQYPDCENAYWSKPTGETCPTCSSLLVFGPKHTVKCSSKECDFTKEAD